MVSQIRILPLLILVAFMSFAVRFVDVVTGVPEFSGVAHAESKKEDEGDAHKEDVVMDEAKMDDKTKSSSDVKKSDKNAPKWRDASDSDFNLANIKTELYKELAERRKKLDEWEKNLRRASDCQ